MASCHTCNQPSGNVAVEKKNIYMRGCEQQSGYHGDAVAGGPGGAGCRFLWATGLQTGYEVMSVVRRVDGPRCCTPAWESTAPPPLIPCKPAPKRGQGFHSPPRAQNLQAALHMQMSEFNCCSA